MFSATSDLPRRIVVAIVAFFPVFVTTVRGLTRIDPVHAELLRSYAAGGWEVTRVVRLPGAVPYLFTGVRVASSLAVISAVVAEYFGGLQNGLGSRITSAASNTAYARAWAYIQDAIWANTEKLKDATYADTTVKFIEASLKGWAFCRDNAEKCRGIVVAKGSKLGASHQLWQMNEVNKLIWPAGQGAGLIDPAAWDQTVKIAEGTKNAEGKTVLTKAPAGEAYTNQYVQKALANLKADGVDVTGASFKPITVTLAKGGA
jgi:hypothetical protein